MARSLTCGGRLTAASGSWRPETRHPVDATTRALRRAVALDDGQAEAAPSGASHHLLEVPAVLLDVDPHMNDLRPTLNLADVSDRRRRPKIDHRVVPRLLRTAR